nr:hypothetical protein BaRGS_005967 [Batillaria attramentaria]
MVDFKREGPKQGDPLVERVQKVRYDPCRTADIAIVAGAGGVIARAAGTSAQLVRKVGDRCVLRMPSKREINVSHECMATLGRVSNIDHNKKPIGKAGRNRWFGTVEAFEMLELPVHRAGEYGNLEKASFLPIACPSPISVRSFNLSPSASSCTLPKMAFQNVQDPLSTDTVDQPVVLSAVVNPIVGWMIRAPSSCRRRASTVTITRTPSAGSCLVKSLGVGLGVPLGPGLGMGVDVDVPRFGLGGEEGMEGAGEGPAAESAAVLQDLLEEEEVLQEVSIYRRAKAALLVTMPVVSLACTVLPLVVVQMLWAGRWSVSRQAPAVVTHLMYVLLPSLNPFLMGMTNRHFRHALSATFCRRQAWQHR